MNESQILESLRTLLKLPRMPMQGFREGVVMFRDADSDYVVLVQLSPISTSKKISLLEIFISSVEISVTWLSREIDELQELINDNELKYLKFIKIPSGFLNEVVNIQEGDDFMFADDDGYVCELNQQLEQRVLNFLQTLVNPGQIAPKNNNGRKTCFWCGAPTKQVPGFNPRTAWDVCTKCTK